MNIIHQPCVLHNKIIYNNYCGLCVTKNNSTYAFKHCYRPETKERVRYSHYAKHKTKHSNRRIHRNQVRKLKRN